MEFLFIIALIFIIGVQFKKIKEQKTCLQDLIDNKKEIVNEEINKLKEEQDFLIQSIQEKNNFNNSLLEIRKKEIDRLVEVERKKSFSLLNFEIEEKKKESLLKLSQLEENLKLNFEEEEKEYKQKIENIKKEFEDFYAIRTSVNAAILRERELQEKQDFYRIDISSNAQEDITILEQIRPQLKNREALSKLVWEVFIQRPTTEMIKRVTAGKDISGIYKITYVKTGESYIGKTTNIKTRWQNHIKTVIGLEGAAHSTLHTHMEKHGLWNYTFEILEEVPKEKLTEREKFYIKLYDTTKQLNMKEG